MGMELTQSNRQITKDEVLAKLKDDGDFDRLRLKIIRKLKDDVSTAILSFHSLSPRVFVFINSAFVSIHVILIASIFDNLETPL